MPKYKKGQVWNKPLTTKMEIFEERTGKNAIWNGKITGGFEDFLWKLEASKARIAKQQKKEVKDSIRWIRKSEKWRTGEIDLGNLGEYKLKAYLHIQIYNDKVQYNISYKIYDKEKKKWLSYYDRTFSLPKPDDYEALDLIRRMKPT